MSLEDSLQRLHQSLAPNSDARERTLRMIRSRVRAPGVLRATRGALAPSKEVHHAVWQRVASAIVLPKTQRVFGQLVGLLTPSNDLRLSLWQRFSGRLAPAMQWQLPRLKWAAAMALFFLLVTLSPTLLLSPRSSASFEATLSALQGNVYVEAGGLWQPLTRDLHAEGGMRIRTDDGQVSLLLGDSGVIRFGSHTVVELLDLTDRLEPATELVPTVKLLEGTAWIQGLVPAGLRGITVATEGGLITMNEGSASVTASDGLIDTEVFDRHVRISHDHQDVTLISDERALMEAGSVVLVKQVADARLAEPWVTGNLGRDAVRRREIAQKQQERLVSRAGILPTSALYPVKRIAEAVDLLLTFDEQSLFKKKLKYADDRLTEAAALLAEGNTDAVSVPLSEYRSTLQALASGSGDATLAQFLLRQSVVQLTSEVSAAMPGDPAYVLKKLVLETSSALPDSVIPDEDVQGGLVLDALSALTQGVENGNIDAVEETWANLQPQLNALERSSETWSVEVRRETNAALAAFAYSIEQQSKAGKTEGLSPETLAQIAAFMPQSSERILSETEILEIAKGMKERIFVYHMTQPRIGQFINELKALDGNIDQGRILRRLYFVLPDGPESFPAKVKQEMLRLRWQKAQEGQTRS